MTVHLSGRRAIAAVVATVALAAVFVLPSVALASTTFTLKKPVPSSASTQTVPKVSVYIVDTYGIKGSASFVMTIDGKTVKPKISLRKAGDYKHVTLSFQIVTALKVGTHTVVVKTKNIKKKTAATSWKFTVNAPTPPPVPIPDPMPVSIAATDCAACHVGYPAAHPMTRCDLCHGPGTPQGGYVYSSATGSAHTLSCLLSPSCHMGPGNTFPHSLKSDCARCHNGTYAGITAGHPVAAEASHVSTSTFCTKSGCHLTSLTVEHYRRTVGGVRLSCATCHSSTDARVIAAITGGSTACESCHDLTAAHAASAKSHTLASVPSCVAAACHTGGANVTAIHAALGGCTDCHGTGKTPSLTCTNCHATDGHPPHTATPASATITIGGIGFGVHACSECHPETDLRVLHGGSTSCAKCHPSPADSAQPWLGGCVQGACHTSGKLAMHATIDASHTVAAAPACTAANCHAGGRNVAAIHAAVGGCPTCHAAGVTPTLVCATTGCHPNGAPPSHNGHPATVTSATITILGASYGKRLCSECHTTTELQAVHGGPTSCAKCHPSPRDSIATWNGGCVQGACHQAGTPLGMHASIDASHTAATASGCTIAGCHAGGTSAAAIHTAVAGRTDSGCGICHARAVPPTLTCAKVGCHPSTTASSHTSHPSTITSGTFTINGTSYGKHLCSECHATMELQALHGGSAGCVKCHPAPRSSFTTWNKGCVQGDCHKTGTALAMHGAINTGHTTTAAAACAVTGCHTGGSDVAAIHAGVGGCAICHSPGTTPTAVCATAGCHPDGPPPSHDAHPATITSSTITLLGASYGKHLCSECHETTELQAVHGGATSCAKCHPSPRNSFTAWTGGCVQGTCHKTGTALAMHGSIDTSHTAPAGACVKSGCHVGNVAALHAPGRGCADCHADGVNATLVCTTCHVTDPHPAHTATLTTMTITIGGTGFGTHACSECHAANDLRDLHGGSTGCSTCHPAPRNTFTDWNGGCVQGGCHAPASASSLHGGIDASHTAPTGACVKSGCHAANVAVLHAPGLGCVDCHAAGKALTTVCATAGCHAGGAPADHNSHPATISSVSMTINGVNYGTHLCSECHATTELQAVHGGATSCAKCHPAPRNSFTAWNKGCVQGDCHKTGTALAMHGSLTAFHISSATAMCTVSGCHTGGQDIVAVHASVGGCAVCHGAGKTPTAVCATVGCHPSGASPLHTSHPATITSGTITIGSVSYGKHLCSECHATTELQAVHGGATSCAKCHPTPRNSFTAWSGGCVQGACHTANTALAMHAGAADAHTVTTTCTSSGCHGGVGDVAAIHASKGGCATCHSAGTTPTVVCATTGCHPNGAPSSHNSHPATVTSGTIVINTVSYGKHLCTECHPVMELQALHGGATSCPKCHPTPRDTITTWGGGCTQGNCHSTTSPRRMHAAVTTAHLTATAPSCTVPGCHAGVTDVAKIHSAKGGCAACHGSGIKPSLACPNCHPTDTTAVHAPFVGTKHTVPAGGSCVTDACHTSADAASLHAPGQGCVDCHGTGVTASLTCTNCHPGDVTSVHATAIGSKHTVPTGPCVNATCHASGDAAAIHAPGLGCPDCHKGGVTPTLDCMTCHPNAADVHTTGTAAHTVNTHPCVYAGCHGSNAAADHITSADALPSHSGPGSSCAACHSNGAATTAVCTNCHSLSWAAPHTGYAYTDFHGTKAGNGSSDWGWESNGTILAPYTRGQAALPCATCHVLGGTKNLYNIATTVNGHSVTVTSGPQLINLCVACHGGTVDDWHQGCFECHGGGMGGTDGPQTMVGADCSQCHWHGGDGWPHGIGWMTGPTL